MTIRHKNQTILYNLQTDNCMPIELINIKFRREMIQTGYGNFPIPNYMPDYEIEFKFFNFDPHIINCDSDIHILYENLVYIGYITNINFNYSTAYFSGVRTEEIQPYKTITMKDKFEKLLNFTEE